MRQGRPYLNEIWPSRLNLAVDPQLLSQLLWREEALRILSDLGLAHGVRTKSRKLMWKLLSAVLDLKGVASGREPDTAIPHNMAGCRASGPARSALNGEGASGAAGFILVAQVENPREEPNRLNLGDMDSTAFISVSNLTKTYNFGRVRALNDVSLDIKAGEIFGLIGPNGAGKTTLMGCLLGLLWPSKGSVTIDGLAPNDLKVKRMTGFMPERPSFDKWMTISQFLTYQYMLPACRWINARPP